jgi:hypothetical protein
MIRAKTTDDLIKIAYAGGSMRTNLAGRSTEDISKIAAAAYQGGAKLHLLGLGSRTTEDLINIATAGHGQGTVMFDDEAHP